MPTKSSFFLKLLLIFRYIFHEREICTMSRIIITSRRVISRHKESKSSPIVIDRLSFLTLFYCIPLSIGG